MSGYDYEEEAIALGLKFISKQGPFGTYECLVCSKHFEYQISAARNLLRGGYKVRCPHCMEEYKNKAMIGAGVELVDSLGKGIYIFKRKLCGHTFKASVDVLVNNKSRECSTCITERIQKEAEETGLKIIGKDGTKYKYLLPCGHTKVIGTRFVKTGGWRCTECYENKIKQSALEFGFEYIGASTKGPHYRLCRVIDCGHYKDVQVHDITGRPCKGVCKECIEIKHRREAEHFDLELIGQAENCDPNYRKYKMNCCGGLQDIMVTHVRRGNFNCQHCGNSFMDTESFLYIIKMQYENSNWLKFGFSKDVEKRIKDYGLIDGVLTNVHRVVKVPTGRFAIKTEKSIHKLFKSYKIESEEMKKYFSVSGFNECYSTNVMSLLEQELNKVEEICNN